LKKIIALTKEWINDSTKQVDNMISCELQN